MLLPGKRGQNMKKTDTKVMVVSAILIAAAIVLSRFLSINAWNLKIGFTFVPVFVAAFLYGPAAAFVVSAVYKRNGDDRTRAVGR